MEEVGSIDSKKYWDFVGELDSMIFAGQSNERVLWFSLGQGGEKLKLVGVGKIELVGIGIKFCRSNYELIFSFWL